MRHIVIDLEMNSLAKEYKEEKLICNREIIQIGAVLLDKQYQEIGAFSTLVKPQYNERIEKKYEKLTGIETEMVQNAPIFQNAIEQFFFWVHSVKDEIQLYQWSESDCEQLTKELELKKIQLSAMDQYLLERTQDFQKEFGDTLGVSRALSLKDAVMYAGVDFGGRMHDALYDAQNTANLLKIIRTPKLRAEALESVIEAFTPKPVGTLLGDLIKFEGLDIPA